MGIRRFTSVVVLSAAALLGGGASALAATGSASAGPAASPSTDKTYTAQFSCDLSAYGYTSSDGTLPTIEVSLGVPTTASQGQQAIVTMQTTALSLPSSVSSQLTNVSAVSVTATVDTVDATASTLTAKGTTAGEVLPGTLTEIPAINTASGTVTFDNVGTGYVAVPPVKLVYTPTGTGTTTFPSITCQPIAASLSNEPVSVSAPAGAATTGPQYTCTNGTPGLNGYAGHLPMTVTLSGAKTVGAKDTVTLTSPGDGLGALSSPGAVAVQFAGDLAVTGAQAGTVTLAKKTSDVSNATFTVSGQLSLSRAGTDHILMPRQFTFTAIGNTGTAISELSCTSDATPPPTALTFTVAAQSKTPSASASPSPASREGTGSGASSGGTTNESALPSGAPATGGGLAPGGLPMIAGAMALLLAGGGAIFVAVRRRKGQAS